MHKPSLYLDTSFFSAYWYIGVSDAKLARRQMTRGWWECERSNVKLVTSAFTEAELSAGVFRGQLESIRMCRHIAFLASSRQVKQLWVALLDASIVPPNQPIDAWHLALTVAFRVDYLLSWNHSHLANPTIEVRLEQLCRDMGLRSPRLVSPQTIPQVRFGQVVRRRSDDD